MEEQTLRYYLKVFSITFLIFFLFINFYFFYVFNKQIFFSDNIFNIEKGERLEKVLNNNTINLNSIDIYFIKIYFLFNKIFNDQFIHYGEFKVDNEISIISLLEEKDKEIRNWQARIKKLPKNLNESEVKEFIIDRSKSDQEIENQIDRLAEKFQEIEQNQAHIPEEMISRN